MWPLRLPLAKCPCQDTPVWLPNVLNLGYPRQQPCSPVCFSSLPKPWACPTQGPKALHAPPRTSKKRGESTALTLE